jgi:DNA-binding beta-propeller fold protein YncE
VDFTSSVTALTATGLNNPTSVAYDSIGNRLFVTDANNNRVLVYDVATITDGEAAVFVIGQPNFTTGTTGTTQTTLSNPRSVLWDGLYNRVFIVDNSNHRVMVYSGDISANGPSATHVLGQSDFTSATQFTTKPGMDSPRGIAYDQNKQRLYVSESNNNRVKVYNVLAITNGEDAVNVLGQAIFTTNTAATTASGLSSPQGLAFDSISEYLFVADSANNRVTVYDVDNVTDNESAVYVLGQGNFTSSVAATTQG